ncbi:uncharacterized protein [Watersipora subatra]|uniref:uncharacterized protein n=1 Tax=Watersipora subatra TaxID=2589382 RepID=UPI00355AF3CD
MMESSVRPSGTAESENPVALTRSCLSECRQVSQAEHKKFYYKGEHVILTTKAGCLALLENAVEYLQNNFNGLPIIQTYQSVGDSKRPQHKTVIFDEDKIIVTGKKSSGLVGQVYDVLNAHFHSPEGRQKIRTETNSSLHTESIVSLSTIDKSTNLPGASIQKEFNTISPNDVSQKDGIIVEDSKPTGTSLLKDQKKPTKTSLFSKAITAIHSQTRMRAQPSQASLTESCEEVRSDKSSVTESNSQSDSSSPDIIILEDFKASSKVFRMCPDASEHGRARKPESVDVYSSSHLESSSLTNRNTCSLPSFMQQLSSSSCQFVSQVEQPYVPEGSSHLEEGNKEVCCTAVANLFSGAVIPPERISSVEINGMPEAEASWPNEEEPSHRSDMEMEEKILTAFVQVYDRELLLTLSQCECAISFPVELIVDTECEILITEQAKDELFDIFQHRLPRIELAMFNPYNSVLYNSSALRRPIVETLERRSASTSDPRSWGDSSLHKRTRNFQSVPAADVLYSESAYNCMDAIPDHASYCPELDEVFKNNAKVVPGVAFTRRPKESQDSQYVQELLSYYEPQSN